MSERIKVSDLMTEGNQLQRMGDYSPASVKVDDETGFLMVDNHGYILPKEKFLEFMKRAALAYESKDIDDFIFFHNFKTDYPRFLTEKVDGKYILPTPNHSRKEFRKDIKQDWSFKCAWCEEKVSSKTDTSYFVLRESLDPYDMTEVHGRFCQEACADNYWYEQVIQFVMAKKVSDYIHTDKRVGKETA